MLCLRPQITERRRMAYDNEGNSVFAMVSRDATDEEWLEELQNTVDKILTVLEKLQK